MPSVPSVQQKDRQTRGGFAVRWLGLEFSVAKAAPPAGLSSVASRGRDWFPLTIREPFTGAWQRNQEARPETVLAFSAVYACVTLIASDISKMRGRLVEQDEDGIWTEVTGSPFNPVLRKPNRYQTRIKFIEQWVVSKLIAGNTYVLKERDQRGVVTALYILDPGRTKPLVAPDGSVWYQLSRDNLAGVDQSVVVPASEIIHDTMVPLFHPLCGVSPLYACGQAAMQGMSIQSNATAFFENGATPGGVLTAPGTIDDVTAGRLKEHWERNYTGANRGKVAVLGDGLKYEKMAMTAVESQMIEQLKWTAETVCSCFHVPNYMVGVGTAPTHQNGELQNQQYYSQCLQALIESIELCLDEGLGLTQVTGKTYGVEFDIDDLLRMDSATQVKTLTEGLKGIYASNEARKKLNLPPVKGGNAVLAQQQNYSLEALAKRDAQEDPFKSGQSAPAAAAPPANDNATDEEIAEARAVASWRAKAILQSRRR